MAILCSIGCKLNYVVSVIIRELHTIFKLSLLHLHQQALLMDEVFSAVIITFTHNTHVDDTHSNVILAITAMPLLAIIVMQYFNIAQPKHCVTLPAFRESPVEGLAGIVQVILLV